MNARIKKLRKELDLTQQEFADRLGIKRNTVATYETGKSNPSDAAVILICREFNVSESWLRTGNGEMFKSIPNNTLDALAEEYNLSHFGRAVIEKILTLSEGQWKMLSELVTGIVADMNKNSHSEPYESKAQATARLSIDEEVEAYRRELEAEEKGTTLYRSEKSGSA